KHAVGQAVPAVEFRQHVRGTVAVDGRAGNEGPYRSRLERLSIVHAMGSKREVLEPAALVELDELRGDLLLELEVGVLREPVVALLVEQAGEIEQVRIAGAVIKPEDGEGFVLPAELAP